MKGRGGGESWQTSSPGWAQATSLMERSISRLHYKPRTTEHTICQQQPSLSWEHT
jgi:hypothetical protein